MIEPPYRSHKFLITDLYLCLFVALQFCFWSVTSKISPHMEILDSVPKVNKAKAFSFGDDQFYFRTHAFQLQVAGWTYGRSTKLSEFNYETLYRWFSLLDSFDSKSNFVPYMASYWYGRTDRISDLKYIIDYLYEYAGYRLEDKWRWQAEAVYLADYKMNDEARALSLALPLETMQDIPIIFRELQAFIYEKHGEADAALKVIEDIKANTKTLSKGELNFMTYFIEDRLKKHVESKPSLATTSTVFNTANNIPAKNGSHDFKIYSHDELYAMTVEGLKLGVTQEEASGILKKDHWDGEWQPFTDSSFEYPFEKDGQKLWLYRVKGDDGRMHIWLIVHTTDSQSQDFDLLLYLKTQRYGEPSEQKMNNEKGGYAYYYTPNLSGEPRLEIDVDKQSVTEFLSDKSLLGQPHTAPGS